MRVECVNLVDPSQHHCVSVFILAPPPVSAGAARRLRDNKRIIFFSSSRATGSRGWWREGRGNGRPRWGGHTFRETDACLQNSADQIRRENVLLYTDKFSCFESCQVVDDDDDGGGDRLVSFLESVLLLGTAAQSRVVDNVSCCIFCARSLKTASPSAGKSRYGTLTGQGVRTRSHTCVPVDKPGNGVETLSRAYPYTFQRFSEVLRVNGLRFYTLISRLFCDAQRAVRSVIKRPLFGTRYQVRLLYTTSQWRLETSDTSRVQDIRTEPLSNSKILYIPEPNENITVFLIPFDIKYNYSSSIFHLSLYPLPPFMSAVHLSIYVQTASVTVHRRYAKNNKSQHDAHSVLKIVNENSVVQRDNDLNKLIFKLIG